MLPIFHMHDYVYELVCTLFLRCVGLAALFRVIPRAC